MPRWLQLPLLTAGALVGFSVAVLLLQFIDLSSVAQLATIATLTCGGWAAATYLTDKPQR